jgi:hypothetical protein
LRFIVQIERRHGPNMVDMDQSGRERLPCHPGREQRFQMRAKIAHLVTKEALDPPRRYLPRDGLSDRIFHVFELPTRAHTNANPFGDVKRRIEAIPKTPAFLRRQCWIEPRAFGQPPCLGCYLIAVALFSIPIAERR